LGTVWDEIGFDVWRKMGLEALCPKPNLSKPAPRH